MSSDRDPREPSDVAEFGFEGKGGVYCENVDIATISSKDPTRMTINDLKDDNGVMRYAIDPDAAQRLWTLSERLIGRPTEALA